MKIQMNKISDREARETMQRFLSKLYHPMAVELTGFHKIDIGWIGSYDSVDFLRTRDTRHQLLGNGPIVVTHDGQVHTTGTSRTTDEYVDEIRDRIRSRT